MGQAAKRESPIRNARKNRVIVCEDLDFLWDDPELRELATMWYRGAGVEIIARHFERDPDEVLIALIHLARADKITNRRSGLNGEF